MNNQNTRIIDHTKDLEKIYNQRRWWLYASSIVYTGLIFTIFGWDYLVKCASDRVWWVLISIALLISINWWYWTMRTIRNLIVSMYNEYHILNEINTDIAELKIILNNQRDLYENTRNYSSRRKSSE